jgi:hypothetical protein
MGCSTLLVGGMFIVGGIFVVLLLVRKLLIGMMFIGGVFPGRLVVGRLFVGGVSFGMLVVGMLSMFAGKLLVGKPRAKWILALRCGRSVFGTLLVIHTDRLELTFCEMMYLVGILSEDDRVSEIAATEAVGDRQEAFVAE